MHDLRLRRLFPIADWGKLEEPPFKSKACSKAAAAYADNLRLVHSLSMVPGYSFMNGENWGVSIVRAMKELKASDPDNPQVAARACQIFDEYDTKPHDQSTIRHFYEATSNAAKMASLPNRIWSHGALHGLLKGIIIQAWTAYEILADDLW